MSHRQHFLFHRGAELARTPRAFSLLAFALLIIAAGCANPASGPIPGRTVFAGFDTSIYPGDETARRWRAASPYRWIGYYLPAPCHREESWVGKRQRLETMGWGIAILYVGQQAWQGRPATDPSKGPLYCARALLSAEGGRSDARDAANRAQQEGFPRGSVIYQDVEKMDGIPAAMRDYYQAWQREMWRDGRYVPGTYAHQKNAVELMRIAEEAQRQAGVSGTPHFWVAGGSGFSLRRPAWHVGLPFARIWQGALDVRRTFGGKTLMIDENVASHSSPSHPSTR